MHSFGLRAALVFAVVAGLVACGGDDADDAAPAPQSSSSTQRSTTSSTLPEHVAARIEVGEDPANAIFAFDAVWVSDHHGDSLSKIDPATNELTATVEVPGEPIGVSALYGSLWTFTPVDRMVKRIDPATEAVVAEISVDSAGAGQDGMVAAAGEVWFPADGGKLVRIDPETNSVVGDIQVTDVRCAGAVASHGASIWYVPECGSESVFRVDAADGGVTAFALPASGIGLAIGLDSLWVIAKDGTLMRVDPATGAVLQSASVGGKGDRVRAGHGRVVVRLDPRQVVDVDPTTLEVVRTLEFPSAVIPGGGMLLTEDSLWVVNFGDDSVDRVSL